MFRVYPIRLPNTIPANLPVISSLAVLVSYAYLIFVNLDYAPFWDDEASVAFIARNMLDLGAPYVFDGRNIYSILSNEINDDLTFRYPQLMIYALAGMFYLFGVGELQARALTALFALAAMILFASCLRREFARQPSFVVVALALACFSPMILLYSRSATYNAPALFWAILLLRLYLAYCDRPKVITAMALTATAIIGFHFHWLISASFVCALGTMHICFRMRTVDRHTLILAAAVLPYVLQAVWFAYFDSTRLPATMVADQAWLQTALWHLTRYFLALNQNGILPWTIVLLFITWRSFGLIKHPYQRDLVHTDDQTQPTDVPTRWTNLRADPVCHYLVLIVVVTIVVALITPQPPEAIWADVRYLIAVMPFAAVVSAAVLWRVWRAQKVVGLVLGAILLCSNLAGWPWLRHTITANEPSWTLPAHIIEFHREYPSSLRTALTHLRKTTDQDDFVYAFTFSPSIMLYYLSDKVYITGVLSSKVKPPTNLATGYEYLYLKNVEEGKVIPNWLVFFGDYPGVIPGQKEIYFVNDKYTLQEIFPNYWRNYRPEPIHHVPLPSGIKGSSNNISIYHLSANPS